MKSVLEQSYSNFEIIIIDDGSTDRSYQKAFEVQDSRITLLKQYNSGPGKTRNRGINLAKGEHITFLDADDKWDPEFLSIAIKRLDDHSECDIFLSGANWEPLGQTRYPILPNENSESGPWKLPIGLDGQVAHQAMDHFTMGALVLRKRIFNQYDGFFDRLKCNSGEDSYLWIQLLLNHKIYREMKPLTHINTEGSDLGIGRGELKPIPPALLYPEELFNHCSQEYKPVLTELLNFMAFFALRREVYKRNYLSAWKLHWKFGGYKKYRTDDFPVLPLAFFVIGIKQVVKKIKHIING